MHELLQAAVDTHAWVFLIPLKQASQMVILEKMRIGQELVAGALMINLLESHSLIKSHFSAPFAEKFSFCSKEV